MLRKAVHFEVKTLGEDGTFEGILSPYGNVDEGGDVVERGAFTKTLQESGSSVPLLWQHKTDNPIGTLELADMADGLYCKGSLVLDLMPNGQPMVPDAHKAYALIKARVVRGLSIGFDAMKAPVEGGIRRLKELKLWEGSVVTFPMNLSALITAVKTSRAAGEAKDDFAAELQEIQLYAARYQMMDALSSSLREILYDAEETDKPAASRITIQQFMDAYVAMLPDYLALTANAGGLCGCSEWYGRSAFATKAGRVLSAANLAMVKKIIDDLQALYDAANPPDGAAEKGTSQKEAAKQKRTEPDPLHSALGNRIDEIKGDLQWKR